MAYFKNIDKLKYDPELIKLIQNEAGVVSDNKSIKNNELGFINDKRIKLINTNNMQYQEDQAAKLERIRQAIKNMALVLGKIVIGIIIERFVSNKVNNFTLKIIKNSEGNENLTNFIEDEINKVYTKHSDYKRCTMEQFKKTSMFNYMISEWRDKDAREIALSVRKHAFDAAIASALGVGIPIPGSTVLMYPIKGALQYLGLDIGSSIAELVVNYKSHCLSMGIHLRPIGYVINNIILYSFRANGKDLVATNLKDPPEDLYKITPEEARKILDKYRDTELVKRDINLIYSKSGM